MRKNPKLLVRVILFSGISIALLSLIIMLVMTPPAKIKANKSSEIGVLNHNFNLGGDFELTDYNGNRVNSHDFRGKLLLIYFGFSFCPDICPANLVEMVAALDKVGNKESEIVPIFITIDPRRDTPEKLKEYFLNFDSRILALSGSQDEIKEVARKFKVYYARSVDGKEKLDTYLINHSSFFYLIGRDGNLIKYYTPGTDGKAMGKDMLKYIAK